MMNINAKSGGIPRRSKLFIHPRLGFATSITRTGEPNGGPREGPVHGRRPKTAPFALRRLYFEFSGAARLRFLRRTNRRTDDKSAATQPKGKKYFANGWLGRVVAFALAYCP